MLSHFHRRIAEKTASYAAPTVTIVALGDSVTQGWGANEVLLHEEVYHARLKRLLAERYPLCTFCVFNAGVAGDNAPGGLARLDRDVIRHAPDLLLIAFGTNDCHAGEAGLPRFVQAMEAIIRRTRSETLADVVLLTPPFLASRDNERVAEVHRKANYPELCAKAQNSGQTARYAQAVREVGARTGVAVADVQAAWQEFADRGADTTAMLANGLNHPDADAHRIPAELVMRIVAG